LLQLHSVKPIDPYKNIKRVTVVPLRNMLQMSYKRGSTRIGKKTLSNFEKLISTYQYICRPRIKLHPRFSKHENKHLEQENSEFIF